MPLPQIHSIGRFILASLLAVVASSAVSEAQSQPNQPDVIASEWMRFLGPDGVAANDQSGVPVSWNDEENIQWRCRLPGSGASSPIVVGDRVFLTCYTGYGLKPYEAEVSPGNIEDLKRHLLCIDRNSGEIQWQRTVDNSKVTDEDPFESYIRHHGYATNTPVSDGNWVYVFFGKAGLFAYDLDGNLQWQHEVENHPNETRWGSAASPFLFHDLLILNANEECGKVFGINKKTGEQIWEYDTQATLAYSTPNIAITSGGEPELVVAVPERIMGLNPLDGSEKWRVTTTHENEVNTGILVDGDVIYSYGGFRKVGSVAIKTGGKGNVTDTNVVWASNDSSYIATPILRDGHLYWINASGIAFCVDAKTGERLYRTRVPNTPGGRGIKFFAAMVAVGDKIYAVSRIGGTFVFRAGKEFELLSHNKIESDETEFNGTPAITANQIFLRSNHYLYCISEQQ